MKQEQLPRQQDNRQDSETPILEWISAAIGLVLTLAMFGFISWQAWKSTEKQPPAIEVQVQRIIPAAGGWVVEIAAVNLSPSTAAAVQIEGELMEGEKVVATSQVTLDYVPGNSKRRGGLFFRENPQGYGLEVHALGYSEP